VTEAVMKEYETVFILDPTLDEAKEKEEVDRVVSLIQENGGTVDEVERWGRRRLAYEIRKKRDGLYTVVHYHAPGEVVKELERRIRLSELYLRVLTVVVDPRRKQAIEEARIAAEKAAEARAARAAGSDSDEEAEVGAER
jgi:small subunit ribosomal protein S6